MKLRRDRNDLGEKSDKHLDGMLQLGLAEEFVRRHEQETIAMEVRAADLAAREASAHELAARVPELEHALAQAEQARAQAEHARGQAETDHGRRVAQLEVRLDEERAANAEHRRRAAELEQQLGHERVALEQGRADVARLLAVAEELGAARRHGRELEIAVQAAQQEVLGERRERQRLQVRLLEAVKDAHRKAGEVFERQLHELEQGRLELGDVAGLEAADEPHLAPDAVGPEAEGRQLSTEGGIAPDAPPVPIVEAESDASRPTIEMATLAAPDLSTAVAASQTEPSDLGSVSDAGSSSDSAPGVMDVLTPRVQRREGRSPWFGGIRKATRCAVCNRPRPRLSDSEFVASGWAIQDGRLICPHCGRLSQHLDRLADRQGRDA